MAKRLFVTLLIVVLAVLALTYTGVINLPSRVKNLSTSPVVGNIANNLNLDVNKAKTVNLSGKGISKIPSYVFDIKNLQELNISNNNFTGALPAEIRNLSNLKILNASNNQMTGVPAEIGQLQYLEILDLSNNKLTGLPYEMGRLKNLKELNLSGNNISQLDLDKIKQGLPNDVKIDL